MIKDYFLLAFGNLRSRGLRSWLTILGIFIGIAAVVSLISLGGGLREAVIGQFGGIQPDELTIENKGAGFGPPGSIAIEKLNDNDLKIIKSVNGIANVRTLLVRVVNVEYNKISEFKYVWDIPKEQELIDNDYENLNANAAEGRLLRAGDSGKVLLGSNFLEDEEFGKSFSAGKIIKLNGEDFEIVGILEKMSSMQLNGMLILPNEDLKDLLDIGDEHDTIQVYVEDVDKVEDVAEEIRRVLRWDRKEKLGEETFSVNTPIQALEAVNTILDVINLIVIGIAMISLFVGAVGIANTMYTSVLERTNEIGIMKAVGARNSDVMWIFMIESGLLGLVGGIVGALIGLGGALSIASMANQALGDNLFRIDISYFLLGCSVLFSFVIGIISGVFPAIQASKLNVVDALRG